MLGIRRREFITLIGGAAWPSAVRGQQAAMPVIGLLDGQSSAASLSAFRQGLADASFVEGRNLSIVYRSAEGDFARLPALAAELVRIPVAVIAAVGGDASVQSAKAATPTIPIVFATGSDPVETGIVTSLNRPTGNVTGATSLGGLLTAKQIGLLRDVVPKLGTIGFLTSSSTPGAGSLVREVEAAARTAGIKVVVANVKDEADIEAAFARFTEQRVNALEISIGVFFIRQLNRLAALTARHAIPAISPNRNFPAAGGLMSYGAGIGDAYRQAGLYAARILRGDKPADLPIMQPTKFNLVINMNTVKALGLTVPPGLLAIADEVIE
jgi:putative ABC transport system substrate-binding protein